MKCDVCSEEIEHTFLKKILGTYVKDSKGKKRSVCKTCQSKHATKEQLIEALK